MLRILLVTIFFVVLNFGQTLAAEKGPKIRVGLVTNQFSAQLEAKGNIKISGNKSLTLKPGKHFVSMKKGVLYVNNTKVGGNSITITGAKGSTPVYINKKNYRGALTVAVNKDKKTLNVINTLNLEDYLYGVVAKEVMPLWPDEAIKAQAVAARSFALYELNQSSYPNYDIKANEMGQVYGGLGAEHSNTTKLIDATKGMAVTYQGSPIQAFFHSTSGGYTESAAYVWGNPVPYLQAVVDYDQEAPSFNWEKVYTKEQLSRALNQGGYAVGELEGIRLSELKQAPMKATEDRGISGRVRRITFKGKKSSVTLTGDKVRSLLGLNSTLFEVAVGLQRPDYLEVPILNRYGMQIGSKKIPIKKDGRGTAYKGSLGDLHLLTDVKDEKIIFTGRGWGHGLGMSQWGARGMAQSKAAKGKKDYYKNILTHYYTGTKVERVY